MFWFLLFTSAWASEPGSVPAIDVGPPGIERSDSVSVLDSARIEKTHAQSSDEVLRAIPGVAASRSGGPGQPSFIYIRGADSAGTLVLLDGIPLNDPSLNNKAFDFSLLDLNAIERIEVWKGPQSAAFGSGATGGVINLISKRGRGPAKWSLGAEGGSFESWKMKAGVQGAAGNLSYVLDANRAQSGGISAASDGAERDAAWINTFSARLLWAPDSQDEFGFYGRYSDKYAALDFAPMDTAPFVFADDSNYRMNGDTSALALSWKHEWASNLSSRLRYLRFAQVRRYLDDSDAANPAWLRAKYAGEFQRVENLNSWKPGFGGEFTLGLSADFENATSDYQSSGFNSDSPRQDSSMWGASLRHQLDRRFYFANAGLRIERHDRFGTQSAVEIAPGLHLSPNLDLTARFATAYKAPTLFELYDPKIGNPNLRPERVRGYELALTRFFDSRRSRLQASVFRNEYRELIQFGSLAYANVGAARAQGLELESRKDFGWIDLQLGYTYLETRDERTGLRLLRRPNNNLSARVEVKPNDALSFGLDWLVSSRRDDLSPVTSAATETAGYQVLNGTLEWKVTPALKIYARVLNLLDQKYEEVAGYGTYRRSYFLGARAEF